MGADSWMVQFGLSLLKAGLPDLTNLMVTLKCGAALNIPQVRSGVDVNRRSHSYNKKRLT